MTLRLRRALYLFVFLLFFGTAPILIFYATGNRYDFGRHTFTSVGALYIKSYPAGAPILIDGKKTGKKTPNRVLNVLPGIHTITVAREGYAPWEKQLEIQAAQTTFIRDIVLFFKKQPSIKLSTGGTQFVSNTSDTAYTYLGADGSIHLTSLISESDYTIPTVPLPDAVLAISPSANSILFSSDSILYTVDVNTEKTTRITQRPLTTTKALWDPFNQDIIWLIRNGGLTTVNLLTGTVEERLDGIDDFTFDGSRLITLSQKKEAAIVSVYTRDTLSLLWDATIVTSKKIHIAKVNNNGLITLQSDNSVWLADPSTDALQNFDAKFISWNNEKLLIATDFEVSYYNHDTKTTQLIDRSSEPLQSILWHPSGSYFLWQKGSALSLIEVDGRNVRNILTLDVPLANNASLLFNKKGSRIFILEPAGNSVLTIQ